MDVNADRAGVGRGGEGPVVWGARLVEMARWATAMHVESLVAGGRREVGAGGAERRDPHGVRGTQAEGLARWADSVRSGEGMGGGR